MKPQAGLVGDNQGGAFSGPMKCANATPHAACVFTREATFKDAPNKFERLASNPNVLLDEGSKLRSEAVDAKD
jgi:hypothetical protein